MKDADETALAGSGSITTYAYNGRGERTSTTTKLSNGQEMVTTTEHDDVDDSDIGVSPSLPHLGEWCINQYQPSFRRWLPQQIHHTIRNILL